MIGKVFATLALVAATVAVGYTAWETRSLRASLDRIAVSNETKITDVMLSLLHSEGQLARIRETVELLSGSDGSDTGARDEGALAGKITATLTAAQREILQQELSKWTRQLRDQREKGWAALRKGLEQKLSGNAVNAEERDERWRELKTLVQQNQQNLATQLKELRASLSNPSGAVEEQGATLTNLEKRLATVLEATQKGQQALTRQDRRDDERWKELRLALQENMEATQQRYAELAARLDGPRDAAQQPAGPAQPVQPETQGQGSSGSQDRGLDRERLAEFCAELPQSAICQDR